MIDSGFNVIQLVGPPVFVLSADVATILDAATGAVIEIETPQHRHISKRGWYAIAGAGLTVIILTMGYLAAR